MIHHRLIIFLCVASLAIYIVGILLCRVMIWKEERFEYYFTMPENLQKTQEKPGQENHLSRFDLYLLLDKLGDPSYSGRAFGILMQQDHAAIFPYLLRMLDNPHTCCVPVNIVQLIEREGRNKYVDRSLARAKLRTLIQNGTAVRDCIKALGVVGMPDDIATIKAVKPTNKEMEFIRRMTCARLGDAESLQLTARYLAASGVVPVKYWHPSRDFWDNQESPYQDIPRAEYIDRKEFLHNYSQAIRELNPESLIIGWPQISDFTFLEGLRIKHLWIEPTKPYNLAFTKHLPLETLRISFTSVSDLSPLAGSHLTTLDLANCKQITNIEPLRGLALTNLVLFSTGVTDLSPVKGMPLESLSLDQTKISDLSPLKGAPLRKLWISNNPAIHDLSPLEGMPLEMLNASRTSIKDLTPLRNCPLKQVWIKDTPVTDLRPISHRDLDDLGVSEHNIQYGMDFVKRITEKMKKAPQRQ